MTIETEFNAAPVCPYCGEEQTDIFEIRGVYTEDDTRIDCQKCSKAFSSVCSVSYSFTTYEVDLEDEARQKAAREEEHRQWEEERKAACSAFPPGTRVRVKPDARYATHMHGRRGTVANRELGTLVHVDLDPVGDKWPAYTGHFDPEKLECVS